MKNPFVFFMQNITDFCSSPNGNFCCETLPISRHINCRTKWFFHCHQISAADVRSDIYSNFSIPFVFLMTALLRTFQKSNFSPENIKINYPRRRGTSQFYCALKMLIASNLSHVYIRVHSIRTRLNIYGV